MYASPPLVAFAEQHGLSYRPTGIRRRSVALTLHKKALHRGLARNRASSGSLHTMSELFVRYDEFRNEVPATMSARSNEVPATMSARSS